MVVCFLSQVIGIGEGVVVAQAEILHQYPIVTIPVRSAPCVQWT